MRKYQLVLWDLCLLLHTAFVSAGIPPAKAVFERYYTQARKFADDYPREKVYLHFDNTSYYLGDTIWFKAYVTLAESRHFSNISRPLYVELVDQMGQVADKQIIPLTRGEGHGQLVLSPSFLSGYYEVRAYTRWMLAFEEPYYFSRTFPVYAMSNGDKPERFISTYDMNPSMKARLQETKEDVSLRFFPEGGNLVEGVPSRVAFKIVAKNEGDLNVSGYIYTEDGEKTTDFHTLHDGMGVFECTPTSKPLKAIINHKGKKFQFALPQVLSRGYVMRAVNNAGAISISVACNRSTPADTLALFISHQGRPYAYQLVHCLPDEPQQFIIPTRKLPQGVLQLSLINRNGNTLCERFVFAYPRAPLQISVDGLQKIYTPYAPIRCEFQLRNVQGEAVTGKMSVSIRDAVRSDYMEYDNNFFTDLLLTSDLKGYIHQPGYYFTDNSSYKQQALDVLLMVHGWRRYDMDRQIDSTPFLPKHVPETDLTYYGNVTSTILKKPLKDIHLSVILKRDEQIITGETITDEQGRFAIPAEELEGTHDAVVQTRKVGKTNNKDATIRIDRHFSPMPRAYAYQETHPVIDNLTDNSWERQANLFDSLYLDSIRRLSGVHVLDEVVIKSKRKAASNIVTRIKEQAVDAYYDVRYQLDMLRDQGKIITTLAEFMEAMNPLFDWNRSDDALTYRQKEICYIMDGHILSSTEKEMMISEIDGLASILITRGSGGVSDDIISQSYMSDSLCVDLSRLDKYAVFYLTPIPYRDVTKHMTAALGTRQTTLQGYTKPLEYYSPVYPFKELYMDKIDKRRTLYWNPNLVTDENGKAVIECYNNQYSTPLTIQIETLGNDGKIGSMLYTTLAGTEEDVKETTNE